MSIELHCKACDRPFDEHDGLVETCRKLLAAEKALKAIPRPDTESSQEPKPSTAAASLQNGEFYWIKCHGNWEVAAWDCGQWWLVGAGRGTDSAMMDEIGSHIPRPTAGTPNTTKP